MNLDIFFEKFDLFADAPDAGTGAGGAGKGVL
jgi:hypothetical protein